MEIEIHELRNLLKDAAELGSLKTLIAVGQNTGNDLSTRGVQTVWRGRRQKVGTRGPYKEAQGRGRNLKGKILPDRARYPQPFKQ